MVAAKAGRTMVGAARAAAANAAVPETKRRLCKVILLGAGPFRREGVGADRTPSRYGKCGEFASAEASRLACRPGSGPAQQVGRSLEAITDPLVEGARPVAIDPGMERRRRRIAKLAKQATDGRQISRHGVAKGDHVYLRTSSITLPSLGKVSGFSPVFSTFPIIDHD